MATGTIPTINRLAHDYSTTSKQIASGATPIEINRASLGAGRYLLTFGFDWPSSVANASKWATIATANANLFYDANLSVHTSYILDLAASDNIVAYANQTSGSTVNITRVYFKIIRLA